VAKIFNAQTVKHGLRENLLKFPNVIKNDDVTIFLDKMLKVLPLLIFP